jgi:hypothetical protein
LRSPSLIFAKTVEQGHRSEETQNREAIKRREPIERLLMTG